MQNIQQYKSYVPSWQCPSIIKILYDFILRHECTQSIGGKEVTQFHLHLNHRGYLGTLKCMHVFCNDNQNCHIKLICNMLTSVEVQRFINILPYVDSQPLFNPDVWKYVTAIHVFFKIRENTTSRSEGKISVSLPKKSYEPPLRYCFCTLCYINDEHASLFLLPCFLTKRAHPNSLDSTSSTLEPAVMPSGYV